MIAEVKPAMNSMPEVARAVVSDRNVLIAVEAVLLWLLFFGVVIDPLRAAWRRQRGAATLSVGRGDQSWAQFAFVYGVASVALTWMVSASNAFAGYKVSLILFNVSSTFYLSFLNPWSRNALLRLLARARRMEEY